MPKEWIVEEPEDGHPMPELGYRLQKRVQVGAGKKKRWKYVTIMIGVESVMAAIAENQNAVMELAETSQEITQEKLLPRV